MKQRQLSGTSYPILIYMTLSSDGVSPGTGLTVTATLSKNGAAFAPALGAVAEVGNGWYTLAGNATDRGTLGPLLVHATATGAVNFDDEYEIVTKDPFAETGQTGDSYAIVNSGTYGNAQLVRATTPANTLDVAATGEAGLDFNNVKDATGAHTLTNIRVPNVTLADTVTTYTGNTVQTGDAYAVTNTRLPAALVSGRMDSSVGAVVSGAIAAAAFSSGALDSVWSTTTRTLSSAGVQAIWDAATSALTSIGSIGRLLVTDLDAAVSSRLASASYTAPDNANIGVAATKATLAADIAEGDESIDKTTTLDQWQQVVKLKGTATEKVRKKLYKSDGVSKVTSDDTIVGQRSET